MYRCAANYDPEDTAALTAAINSTASTICFSNSFNKVCGEFVKSKLLNSGAPGNKILDLPDYDLYCLESTSQQPTTNGTTSSALTA